MAMRVSGINSGLDTDAIVQELVSAYSKKTEKYEKEQTKLSWKQDIWKSLNSKVYGLYTKISNMRFSSAYAIKTVNSSDTTKATVSAGGNAVNGTHKLNVLQTAQSAYLTSNKVQGANGAKVTADTTLKDLGFTDDAYIRIKTNIGSVDEENVDIKLTGDTKISDVTEQLNKAGLTASFDENQGRFYISSKVSGAQGNFEIGAASTKSIPMVDDKGNFIEDDFGNVKYEDVNVKPSELAASNRLLSVLGIGNADAKASAGGEIKTKKGDAVNLQTKLVDILKTTDGEIPGLSSFKVKVTEKGENGAADKVTEKTIAFNPKEGDSVGDVLKQFQDAGINASFDAENSKFVFYNGKDEIKFEAVDSDEASGAMIKALGLEDTSITDYEIRKPIKMDGQDAKIVLDGVVYTNSSNEFSINGLNITAQGITDPQKEDSTEPVWNPDNAITLTTNTDNQGLYDTVKNFLTEYNSIINEITKLYNADSARDYEPLTDEEKDAMSDTEIAKWETKIKDSLLRRDNSLNSLMSAMINSMNTAVQVGDKSYTLTSFGIHTLGFLNAVDNEQYAFHIDGDAEDENTSGEDDKLMKAIQEDPDTVIEFMKQLSTNLYNAIDKQMQGNSLRTRYKIYNDKEMDTQYQNYSKTIKEWENKVSAKEDYYYKKFSQMETALAKLNSQQSSLAGLLGN